MRCDSGYTGVGVKECEWGVNELVVDVNEELRVGGWVCIWVVVYEWVCG